MEEVALLAAVIGVAFMMRMWSGNVVEVGPATATNLRLKLFSKVERQERVGVVKRDVCDDVKMKGSPWTEQRSRKGEEARRCWWL